MTKHIDEDSGDILALLKRRADFVQKTESISQSTYSVIIINTWVLMYIRDVKNIRQLYSYTPARTIVEYIREYEMYLHTYLIYLLPAYL